MFTREATGILTGDRWRIVVELNVTEIEEEVLLLQQSTRELRGRLVGLAASRGHLWLGLAELDRILSLVEEMWTMVQSVAEMLPHEDPRQRAGSKRGLLDIGGTLIKAVFGNPDANDLRHTQEKLQVLDRRVSDVIHLQQDHLTVTQRLGNQVERNGRQLRLLTSQLSRKLDELGNSNADLTQQLGSLNASIYLHWNVSSLLRHLELNVLKANLEIRHLQEALTFLLGGGLGPSLISPIELSRILADVLALIPPGLELVGGVHVSDMNLYYEIAETHAFSTAHSININIDIPLTAEGRRFLLYRTTPLPTPDPQLKRHVMIQTRTTQLLVMEDREFFAEVGEEELSLCAKKTLWICPVSFALIGRDVPSCMMELVLGVSDQRSPWCAFQVVKEDFPPYWLWYAPESTWIYSLPKSTRWTSYCRDHGPGSTNERTLVGVGIVRAARGCTMRSQHYQLLPNSQGATRWNLHHQIIPKQDWETVLNWTEEGAPPEAVASAVHLQDELGLSEEEGSIATSVGELLVRTQKWKGTRFQWKLMTGGLAVSGLTLVTILIIAPVIYCHHRHLRNRGKRDTGLNQPLVIYGLPPTTTIQPTEEAGPPAEGVSNTGGRNE